MSRPSIADAPAPSEREANENAARLLLRLAFGCAADPTAAIPPRPNETSVPILPPLPSYLVGDGPPPPDDFLMGEASGELEASYRSGIEEDEQSDPWPSAEDVAYVDAWDKVHSETQTSVPTHIDVASGCTQGCTQGDAPFQDEAADDDDLSLYMGAERLWHRDFMDVTYHEVKLLADDPANAHAFPAVLHRILTCGRYQDSISWLPSGRAFAIVDDAWFFEQVCPSYSCLYDREVFAGWLALYGFRRVDTSWCENGGCATYSHERFLHDRWWLACTMRPRCREAISPVPPSAMIHACQLPPLDYSKSFAVAAASSWKYDHS